MVSCGFRNNKCVNNLQSEKACYFLLRRLVFFGTFLTAPNITIVK